MHHLSIEVVLSWKCLLLMLWWDCVQSDGDNHYFSLRAGSCQRSLGCFLTVLMGERVLIFHSLAVCLVGDLCLLRCNVFCLCRDGSCLPRWEYSLPAQCSYHNLCGEDVPSPPRRSPMSAKSAEKSELN